MQMAAPTTVVGTSVPGGGIAQHSLKTLVDLCGSRTVLGDPVALNITKSY